MPLLDDLSFAILRLYDQKGLLKLKEVHDYFNSSPELYPFKGQMENLSTTIVTLCGNHYLTHLNIGDTSFTSNQPGLIGENMYELTKAGRDIYIENATERNHLKDIEQLNRKKLSVDVKLAEATLKSYPFTKWSARIAFVISIVLAGIEIYRAFKK